LRAAHDWSSPAFSPYAHHHGSYRSSGGGGCLAGLPGSIPAEGPAFT